MRLKNLELRVAPYTPGDEAGFALVDREVLVGHREGEKLPVRVGDDGYELTTENVSARRLAEVRVWTADAVLLPFVYVRGARTLFLPEEFLVTWPDGQREPWSLARVRSCAEEKET